MIATQDSTVAQRSWGANTVDGRRGKTRKLDAQHGEVRQSEWTGGSGGACCSLDDFENGVELTEILFELTGCTFL